MSDKASFASEDSAYGIQTLPQSPHHEQICNVISYIFHGDRLAWII